MFLGTPKSWWVVIGICFLIGLALAASGVAGTPGVVIGVILVFASIVAFAGAPMRYGDRARRKTEREPTPPAESGVAAPPSPPRPRARIEARDASDV
jgi:hypothetical protein